MTSAPLPPELAYLDAPVRQLQLQQAAQGGGKEQRRLDWSAKIARVYGSEAHYAQVRQNAEAGGVAVNRLESAGVLFQPIQFEFALWASKCDSPDGVREVAMGGQRGPGKSFCIFAVVCLIDCQKFPGIKVLFLRKTGAAAKEQMQDLIQSVLGAFPDKIVTGNKIVFANGSSVTIGGFKDDAEAQKYQGVEYDILVVEEATQLTETTYKLLKLSERSSKMFNGVPFRPRTYLSFNPLGPGHQFFKKRFVDPERNGKPHKNRKFIFGRVADNLFNNPEYVQNLQELVGVYRRAYLEGDFDVSAGAFFDTFRYPIHVINPLDDVSWLRSVWCSMDYGFQHWNITMLHGEDGDGTLYTLHELAHRKTRPAEIAPDIFAMLNYYKLEIDQLDGFLIGTDAFHQTGAAQFTVADQYAQLGIAMTPAETAAGSRSAGAAFLAQKLGDPDRDSNPIPPSWYITRRCPLLADCLPYLEVSPTNNEDVRKVDTSAEGLGGDDPYDCARYGLFNPRRSAIG